jgi:ATP-dependent RNA helicase RhlE
MTFQELQLPASLLKALQEKQYQTPTPIQIQSIPIVLEGCDLLGTAQTGTGKTAAFALPILAQLLRHPAPQGVRRAIRALILTPTRELALQIDESIGDYAKYTRLRSCVIFGGVSQRPQTDQLARGVDILTATPGRLLDLITQGYVSLQQIEYFVLDEADRMLDMGFIHDIRRLLPLLPQQRQTLLFSATMPKPIEQLAATLLHKPQRVSVAPVSSVVDRIEQQLCYVEKPDKKQALISTLQHYDGATLVFSRTKHGADRIARIVTKAGIGCDAIHGDKSQTARQRALSNFKSGRTRVIVATDIAARGIDIDQLELVINYDLPDVAETYVHRIGRTGRAGRAGMALTFCSVEERPLLKDIEKLTGKKLHVIAPPTVVAQ